jgi:tetratricopeptide (TPR) repeat protein
MKFGRIVLVLAILAMIACVVQPVMAELEFDNGSMASTYYNRGSQAASAGNLEIAVYWFDQALASNTSIVAKSDTLLYIYKDKAAVLADLGNYSEAVATADQGLALYTKDPGLWNNKGYALFRQGKYDDAVNAYNKAISIAEAQNETYLKGYINKGIALNKAGKPYDAITAFNKALELDPGNADATTGLAEAQSAATTLNMVLGVIVIVAIGLVVWYIKFRKPSGKKSAPGKKDNKQKKE